MTDIKALREALLSKIESGFYYADDFKDAQTVIRAQDALLAEAVAALKFYASPMTYSNWQETRPQPSVIELDIGRTAQIALAKLEGAMK